MFQNLFIVVLVMKLQKYSIINQELRKKFVAQTESV